MPLLPVIADHFLVSAEQSQAGLPCFNVFCIEGTGSGTLPSDVAARVAIAWTATNSFAHFQHADQLYVNLAVTPLDGTSLTFNHGTWGVGHGTAAGTVLPAGTSVLYTLETGQRGRSFRGRFYLGGCVEAVGRTDGTGPDTSASPNVLDAASLFMSSLSAAGYTLKVLSRVLGVATEVTDAVGRPYWGSQRLRNFA